MFGRAVLWLLGLGCRNKARLNGGGLRPGEPARCDRLRS